MVRAAFAGSTAECRAASPGADETLWTFHEASGLLNSKTYEDSSVVSYTYESHSALKTRVWARNPGSGALTTTYAYFDGQSGSGGLNTGEMREITYSDSTPTVSYTYDRVGRHAGITDAVGTRAFAYDADTLQPLSESFTAGMFAGGSGTSDDLVISQAYQVSTDANYVPGRWKGVQIGTATGPSTAYNAEYGYDGLGRLVRVAGPGLPTGTGVSHGAFYTFAAGANGSNTDLLAHTEIRDSGGAVKVWSDRTYESTRDLIDAVTNTFGGTSSTSVISKYDYANDSLARRSSVVYTGEAFTGGSGDHNDVWQYNNRNELTQSERFTGATAGQGAAVDALDRAFAYDNIGNRKTYTEGTSPQVTYDRNGLNQYTQARVASPLSNQRFSFDDGGNLIELFAASDLNGDGAADETDLALFLSMYGSTLAEWVGNNGNADYFRRADSNANDEIDLADAKANPPLVRSLFLAPSVA